MIVETHDLRIAHAAHALLLCAQHVGRETFAVGARYELGLRTLGPEAAGKRSNLTYLAALEWRLP